MSDILSPAVDAALVRQPAESPLDSRARQAIHAARRHLLDHQQPDGHWVGELEGDTILESETILLWAYLGLEQSSLARKAAQYLVEKQLATGGWALYPGGAMDVSASVKGYFALKLTGQPLDAEPLQRARRAILSSGGADRVNSFTRFYLALLGQISYDHCPEVPPEFVLLPQWMPIHLYRISAWSRTIFLPLSIVSAYRPVRELPAELGIRELFIERPECWPPLRSPAADGPEKRFSWERFFRLVDSAWRFCRRWNLLPLRRRAIAEARRWMLERFAGSDGLGAIHPPVVWSLVALRCLGYAEDSPEMRYCQEQLHSLVNEEEHSARLVPCKSPVWDTAITLRALVAAGIRPDAEPIRHSTRWLLTKEIRRRGDWAQNVSAEPSGWCFEYNNAFYPDLDDTAMVLLALRTQLEPPNVGGSVPPGLQVCSDLQLYGERRVASRVQAGRQVQLIDAIDKASRRAIAWVLALQNRDGGWGAFDRDNDCELLCRVPFADHNAMIDPSTPDLTARVLEALGQWGRKIGAPAIDRAVAYLRKSQEADGSWFGRWGVNYIYGTWQALEGLASVGVPADDAAMAAGARWLLAHQQPCGAWGETPDSYADPGLRGQGEPTASQSAWAILGLLAAGRRNEPALARGVRWLLDTQQPDGTWEEQQFTGTGFPQVFYLRYHMYPVYFPLMALSRWASLTR